MSPTGEKWLKEFDAAVAAALPALSPEARHLLDAHAALECGWGTANAWARGFNFGNLTAGPAWRGAKWTDKGGDLEFSPDGRTFKRVDQTWRAYLTVGDAVADYWSFLGEEQNHGRYVAARKALEAGDCSAFAVELAKAGYYTLPMAEYLRRLQRVLAIVSQSLAAPKEHA